ncbi:MAG: flagellar biosynthetic protein FliO [Bdellovibrionota bacterium]|nr:MAG: flagellar biosynthetic protein FliO [Bdellovibrionota bacterium]
MKVSAGIVRLILIAAVAALPIPGVCADEVAQPFAEKLARTRAMLEAKSMQSAPVAPISSLPKAENEGSGWLRMIEGLALCVGVFLIGIGLVKRRRKDRGLPMGRRMRVIERLAVSTRGAVVLMKVDEREFLVGVGGEGISVTPLQEQPVAVERLVQERAPDFESESVINLSRVVGTR